MMKIAAMTDIHGNLEALKAVIADIKKEQVEKIFICGDLVVAGSEPSATLELLLTLPDSVIIMGNTEDWLFSEKNWPDDEKKQNDIRFAQQALNPRQLEYLKYLPEQHTEQIGKLSIRLVHEEHIGKQLLKEEQYDIIICGHTHLPAAFKSGEKLLINTGSVGKPFTDNQEACYLILKYPDMDTKDYSFQHKYVV